MGNNFITYSEKDISDETRYQKGLLVKFINNLEYIGGYLGDRS